MISEQIDTAISVIKYDFRQRQKRINEIKRKLAPSSEELKLMGSEITLIENVSTLIKEVKEKAFETLGKLPPQDIQLEQSVLGALISEPGFCFLPVNKFLKAEHFYLETHQRIYGALLALRDARESIDMRTVVDKLRKTGHLEVVGGAFYVAEICSTVSSSANCEQHARLLIEGSIKREFIRMCGETLSDAYDDTADALDMIDQVEARLNKIKEWTKR